MADPLETTDDAAAVIRLHKALSDPNRLQIFAELMRGDSCNCVLQERLGLAPSLLSHHLRVLSDAGLVDSRRDRIDGRWIYYSVNRAAAARWQAWFSAFFDPMRIASGTMCGPEGQVLPLADVVVAP